MPADADYSLLKKAFDSLEEQFKTPKALSPWDKDEEYEHLKQRAKEWVVRHGRIREGSDKLDQMFVLNWKGKGVGTLRTYFSDRIKKGDNAMSQLSKQIGATGKNVLTEAAKEYRRLTKTDNPEQKQQEIAIETGTISKDEIQTTKTIIALGEFLIDWEDNKYAYTNDPNIDDWSYKYIQKRALDVGIVAPPPTMALVRLIKVTTQKIRRQLSKDENMRNWRDAKATYNQMIMATRELILHGGKISSHKLIDKYFIEHYGEGKQKPKHKTYWSRISKSKEASSIAKWSQHYSILKTADSEYKRLLGSSRARRPTPRAASARRAKKRQLQPRDHGKEAWTAGRPKMTGVVSRPKTWKIRVIEYVRKYIEKANYDDVKWKVIFKEFMKQNPRAFPKAKNKQSGFNSAVQHMVNGGEIVRGARGSGMLLTRSSEKPKPKPKAPSFGPPRSQQLPQQWKPPAPAVPTPMPGLEIVPQLPRQYKRPSEVFQKEKPPPKGRSVSETREKQRKLLELAKAKAKPKPLQPAIYDSPLQPGRTRGTAITIAESPPQIPKPKPQPKPIPIVDVSDDSRPPQVGVVSQSIVIPTTPFVAAAQEIDVTHQHVPPQPPPKPKIFQTTGPAHVGIQAPAPSPRMEEPMSVIRTPRTQLVASGNILMSLAGEPMYFVSPHTNFREAAPSSTEELDDLLRTGALTKSDRL